MASSMPAADNLYLLLVNEIVFVWPTRWSPMKFVFLVNKYMALGDAVFQVGNHHRGHYLKDACSIFAQFYYYWYLTGTICSELIVVTRTLALWGFNKHLTVFVILAGLELVPEVYYGMHDWAAGVSYLELVIVLTMIKKFRDNDSRFWAKRYTMTVLKGTVFWVIVLVLPIANFVVMFLAPVKLSNCMQPGLCTRVLLNLRKAATHQCPTSPDFTLSITLVFDRYSAHEMEVINADGGFGEGEALGGDLLDDGEGMIHVDDVPSRPAGGAYP
ncbi:hypothetical protein V8D89_004514 [Ganoderma adspersum]